MHFLKTIFCVSLIAFVAHSKAGGETYVFVSERDTDVVYQGRGKIDLTELEFARHFASDAISSFSAPIAPLFAIGAAPFPNGAVYEGGGVNPLVVAPATFASTGPFLPDTVSGDFFGTAARVPIAEPAVIGITVPIGYTSNDPLAATMTFENTSLTDMGLSPGRHTWSWGSGNTSDSLSVLVGDHYDVVVDPGTVGSTSPAGGALQIPFDELNGVTLSGEPVSIDFSFGANRFLMYNNTNPSVTDTSFFSLSVNTEFPGADVIPDFDGLSMTLLGANGSPDLIATVSGEPVTFNIDGDIDRLIYDFQFDGDILNHGYIFSGIEFFGIHADSGALIDSALLELSVATDDSFFTVLGTVVEGDFDESGTVDGLDFLAWQRGESPNPLTLNDLSSWMSNYVAASSMADVSVVPEPAALPLVLLSVCLAGSRRLRMPATHISEKTPELSK